jgi:hypothetical protein
MGSLETGLTPRKTGTSEFPEFRSYSRISRIPFVPVFELQEQTTKAIDTTSSMDAAEIRVFLNFLQKASGKLFSSRY